ncbi:MAG TPA: M56 family metallopeptidase [Planctomycetaceae bacterium]|nr:M56 family metallopeptidase [Planctomycetaceae bacterium]
MIREPFLLTTPELPVWLLRLIFSVTLVCVSAALASVLLRRFSAAMRHRIWALCIAGSLAMPAMILWSPEIRLGWVSVAARPSISPDAPLLAELKPTAPAIEFDPRVFEAQETDSNAPLHRAPESRRASVPRATPSPSPLPSTAESQPDLSVSRNRIVAASAGQTPLASRVDPNTFWLLALLVPAGCGIWQLVRAARAVRRVVNEARLVQDAAALEIAADVCRRLQWHGVLELRQSSRTPIPVCVGWKKPCILLPPEWKSWGEMTLRAVLAHEVSHIVRRDVAWQMVARLACYLYWFHPLVWLAARKMRVERETACDDSVLAIVERPVDYASVLLRFAREMVAQATPAAALPMSSFSGLEGRVRAILDKSRPRSPVGPRVSRLCALGAIVIAASAASLSPLSREMSSLAAANEGKIEATPNQVGDPQSEQFRLEATQNALAQQHLPTAPLGEISGRVVLTSDAQKGLARARILGIPENPKAAYVTATADAQGNFHVPRPRSAMLFLAQNEQQSLCGIARVEPQESSLVILVGRSVAAKGRLLDWQGRPLGPNYPMEYRLVVDGTFLDEFHVYMVRDAKRVFGGYAYTDKNGDFTVPGLAPGWKYRMSCCPGILVGGQIQPFVTLATFTTAQTGITQLGKVTRPRAETMDDAFLNAASAPEQIEKVRDKTSESARLLDQRVLVVAGSRKNEVVRGIRAVVALDSPVALDTMASATDSGGPTWSKDQALHVALNNYAVMGLDVGGPNSTTRAFLDRYKITAPADDDVTLAALEIDGRVVAQTTGRALFGGKSPSDAPLTQWLVKQSPKLPDAKKLLKEALAQARRDNKCVFLLENATGLASGFCCRLSHYVEQYKSLIEKDYVVLKLDVRYPNVSAVLETIRDFGMNDYQTSGPTLPWMVILDAFGRPAVSGTSPRGNIGIPESVQETSYFEWMLRATAQRLTDDEIATLVAGLKEKH